MKPWKASLLILACGISPAWCQFPNNQGGQRQGSQPGAFGNKPDTPAQGTSVRQEGGPDGSGSDTDDNNTWEALVITVHGSVMVQTPEKKGRWVRVKQGFPLASSDVIKTGADSYAELSFDGGQGLAGLSANTRLLVDTLAYDGTSLTLRLGRIMGGMKNTPAPERDFSFTTPNALIGIRGVNFGLQYDPDKGETAAAACRPGLLGVTSALSETARELLLHAGEETVLNSGTAAPAARQLEIFSACDTIIAALKKHAAGHNKNWSRMSIEDRRALRRRMLGITGQQIPRLKPVSSQLTGGNGNGNFIGGSYSGVGGHKGRSSPRRGGGSGVMPQNGGAQRSRSGGGTP